MSTAKQTEDHYFQLHGLRAQPPEALNQALQDAIGCLQASLHGPACSELTAAEVEMLERSGVDLDEHPEHSDPVAEYVVEYAAILATSLTPTEAAARLRLTPVRVRQMIGQRVLYAIRVNKRWQVPIYQFDDDVLIPNIGRVNEHLGELDPVSAMRWYTTPDAELEDDAGNIMTPLEWLKTGRDPRIVIDVVPEA